ncbi:MAG: phosphoribosylaminoimidazolesuccinocarboxamide synthase [Gammaproteobacteria bacterium]|nr:phosphoribosylaminoimidazolesuccinocarboxamide synthase [Gammaproteobacteria bacterium]
MKAVYETNLKNLELLVRGKVRDMYKVDDEHLMIVTTDRLSAFDVIMPDPIPAKGKVLTQVSNFWFNRSKKIIQNHLVDFNLKDYVANDDEYQQLEGRTIIVKKMKALPVEAIVRGYLIGSGWKDYQQTGEVCGIALPEGLEQAQKLPEILYTPSTKADVGDHDMNVDYQHTVGLLGEALAAQIKSVSIELYKMASEYALERGIIIADTKFEFGLDREDNLVLIDEILTPDSSRFWPLNQYQQGVSPPSFDKQYVRDYLETLDWDKKAPGPKLPDEVIKNTQLKYKEAMDLLL